MRITIKYGSYNKRRYSRPWIAKVTSWPVGGRPELLWGGYVGDDNGGECEIEAEEGDILKSGQKDGRGNGGSNDFYHVEEGKAVCVTDTFARQLWQESIAPASLGKAEPILDAPSAEKYQESIAVIAKLRAALQEIAAGNLDDETYEQFHDRARRVAKEAGES